MSSKFCVIIRFTRGQNWLNRFIINNVVVIGVELDKEVDSILIDFMFDAPQSLIEEHLQVRGVETTVSCKISLDEGPH